MESSAATLPPASDAPARRRCLNCPKFYKVNPKQSGSPRRFCSAKCRVEFHKNGAGFGRLREAIPKWINQKVREVLAEQHAARPAEPRGMTQPEVESLLMDFDFVSRREFGAGGVELVKAAAKRKQEREWIEQIQSAAVEHGSGRSTTRRRSAS